MRRRRFGSTPLRRAACSADWRALARYSPRLRCDGLDAPPGRRGGASSLGRSSRMLRAAESAARSAARCARPAPVIAPPSEAITRAATSTRTAAPTTAGSAWPESRARPRARRDICSERLPPGRTPASALRAANAEGRASETRTQTPFARPSAWTRAASDRSAGRSASSTALRAASPGASRAAGQSPGGTRATSTPARAAVARAASSARAGAFASTARWQRCPRADALTPRARSAASSARAAGDASIVGPRRAASPAASATRTSGRTDAATSIASAAATAGAALSERPLTTMTRGLMEQPPPSRGAPMHVR